MSRAVVLVAAALLAAAAAGGAAAARVSIFYYPWYGTPAVDGEYHHWHQNGARPPSEVASAYFPARGVYSSSDLVVLWEQMDEIKAAGIDEVAVSWWGRGSVEDARLPAVLLAARAAGLAVGAHLEPYAGRTPESTVDDVAYLRLLGVRRFFVYAPQDSPAAAWAAVKEHFRGVRVYGQTALAGFAAAARFDGLYTYDILVYGGDKLARICAQARRQRLACAPSVGPGYDARRAVGDQRVKPRRNGRTYDAMWTAAILARPDEITITSYNEWHEGTQLEPARARRNANGGTFGGYTGAWGLRGASAQYAYLDRTAFWSSRFRATRRAAAKGRSTGGPPAARPTTAGA